VSHRLTPSKHASLNLNPRLMKVGHSTYRSLFGAHWSQFLQSVTVWGSMPRTRTGPADKAARAFLRAGRKALGLTQGQFGVHAGVRQQQISKYERGRDRVPLDLIKAIEVLWGEAFESFQRAVSPSGSTQNNFGEGKQATYSAGTPLKAAKALVLRIWKRCCSTLARWKALSIAKAFAICTKHYCVGRMAVRFRKVLTYKRQPL
jgi:transcriptional regulator with XRE-family HTH domain